MKKKAMIAVVFVGVLFAGLCFLSSNPIISCKIDILYFIRFSDA